MPESCEGALRQVLRSSGFSKYDVRKDGSDRCAMRLTLRLGVAQLYIAFVVRGVDLREQMAVTAKRFERE